MPQILGNLKGTARTPLMQSFLQSCHKTVSDTKVAFQGLCTKHTQILSCPLVLYCKSAAWLSKNWVILRQGHRGATGNEGCHMWVMCHCLTRSSSQGTWSSGPAPIWIAPFSSYLPTSHCFKLCFSPFVLTRCTKGWFSRSGRFWKGAFAVVPASSCRFRTAPHCILLSFPKDASICKIFLWQIFP